MIILAGVHDLCEAAKTVDTSADQRSSVGQHFALLFDLPSTKKCRLHATMLNHPEDRFYKAFPRTDRAGPKCDPFCDPLTPSKSNAKRCNKADFSV